MRKRLPTLKLEQQLWEKNYFVIGIDEVGRGAFAGPLYVGGVIFKPTKDHLLIKYLESLGINDSKQLTPKKRDILSSVIKQEALCYSLESINVPIINKVGIGKATQMAVRKLVKIITNKQHIDTKYFLLMDAFNIKYIQGIGLKNQKAITYGDSISLSIAAASIIAKVERDQHMTQLSFSYPFYKFGDNKGYGTQQHRDAIKQYGILDIHRISYIKL